MLINTPDPALANLLIKKPSEVVKSILEAEKEYWTCVLGFAGDI